MYVIFESAVPSSPNTFLRDNYLLISNPLLMYNSSKSSNPFYHSPTEPHSLGPYHPELYLIYTNF